MAGLGRLDNRFRETSVRLSDNWRRSMRPTNSRVFSHSLDPEQTSRRAKVHLAQYRATEQAVWIAELLHHLEVVVAFHD